MKQITNLRKKIAIVMLAFGLMLAPAAVVPVSDVSANKILDGARNADTGPNNIENVIEDLTNVLLFLIGAVAVIMIVVGGLKYVTSNGNAEQIKSAKNTIMYAVIGIVVAILAYAIVRFVVNAFA